MIKLLSIFCLLLLPAVLVGQEPDSIIRELLEPPKKNILPALRPTLSLKDITTDTPKLDLRLNYWKSQTTFGINVSQSAFSDNWSGGGVNSIALGLLFNHRADFTKEDRNYTSELLFQYGKLKNKDQLERKTNDRLFWDNKVGLKMSENWNFFGSINIESQFDNGYSFSRTSAGEERRTLISKFLSPGYITESLGIEYKPSKEFWVRIGTGTARQTIVLDTTLYKTNSKNFGVPIGKKVRNELAFQVVSALDKNLTESLNIRSRYVLFANYENLKAIDHRLDLTFTSKVAKLINVQLSGVLLFDKDTHVKVQGSQGLSVGLQYKLQR